LVVVLVIMREVDSYLAAHNLCGIEVSYGRGSSVRVRKGRKAVAFGLSVLRICEEAELLDVTNAAEHVLDLFFGEICGPCECK
jgi:hypothetical protein